LTNSANKAFLAERLSLALAGKKKVLFGSTEEMRWSGSDVNHDILPIAGRTLAILS